MAEWYGIDTDECDNMVCVDLKKIEPTREHVNDILLNLLTLELSCLATDQPSAKYINEIIRNYCYHPLKRLDLRGCKHVSDDHLAVFAEAGSLCGVVDLRGCAEVKEQSVCALLEECVRLHPDKIMGDVKSDISARRWQNIVLVCRPSPCRVVWV